MPSGIPPSRRSASSTLAYGSQTTLFVPGTRSVSRCRSKYGVAYRKTCCLDGRLHLSDAQRAKVENGRGEHRIGACGNRGWEVRSLTSSARRDERDVDLSTYCPDHLQVKAAGGAIGVHG